jgi:hypothetical protein
MSCLGVHFALTSELVEHVLACEGNDHALLELQEDGEVSELWNTPWVQECDVAWDAIDRCLVHGAAADSILRKCVLGGRSIYGGDDLVMRLISPQEVAHVASAIRDIDEAWMRSRYFQIDPIDYGFPVTEDDFAHTWYWFRRVQGFFALVASANRWVLFTASQ